MREANRNSHCRKIPDLVRCTAVRFVVFAAVWFVLTGSELESWILGVPAVFFAVALSLFLSPSSSSYPLSLSGICRFILFFLRQSSLSGIDVMRRVLSPRLLINPGLVSYITLLPKGAPRVFFVNTISLLPGTLSADLQGDTVIVHTLDKDLPVWANIQKLEGIIAVLFRGSAAKGKIP